MKRQTYVWSQRLYHILKCNEIILNSEKEIWVYSITSIQNYEWVILKFKHVNLEIFWNRGPLSEIQFDWWFQEEFKSIKQVKHQAWSLIYISSHFSSDNLYLSRNGSLLLNLLLLIGPNRGPIKSFFNQHLILIHYALSEWLYIK